MRSKIERQQIRRFRLTDTHVRYLYYSPNLRLRSSDALHLQLRSPVGLQASGRIHCCSSLEGHCYHHQTVPHRSGVHMLTGTWSWPTSCAVCWPSSADWGFDSSHYLRRSGTWPPDAMPQICGWTLRRWPVTIGLRPPTERTVRCPIANCRAVIECDTKCEGRWIVEYLCW